MLLDAADDLPVDKRVRRRVLDFELDSPGLTTEAYLEILVALEDGTDIVRFEAGGQYSERAAAEEVVDAALARVEKLLDFTLREVFQTPQRRHSRIHHPFGFPLGDGSGRPNFAHGLISIGVSGGVISQISTMSEFATAMQPSVQSTFV